MKKFLATIMLSAIMTASAFAIDPVYTSTFGNQAIKGYDTVAYFTEGKPVKGKKEFSYEYLDAEWRFASAENLETFKADPTKYAPQFGGYCAYAVSQNTTASIKPELWAIVDGKLYLNYSNSVQKRWDGDREGFIKAAQENWKGILCANGKNSDLAECQ